MKIEEQVVSLELAEKLKELGVEQESEWYWNRDIEFLYHVRLERSAWMTWNETAFIPAYTVAELGEMLPMSIGEPSAIGTEQPYSLMTVWNDTEGWSCAYCPSGGGNVAYYLQLANTETDARAQMLIHLLENNIL